MRHCLPNHLARALIAVSIAASATAQGVVRVVDAAGTTPYPTIQGAVNASQHGDIVFVLDHPDPGGVYAGFQLSGLGVTVMGRPSEGWSVADAYVQSVPAGQRLALVGLTFSGPAGVRVTPSHGHVSIERCRILTGPSDGPALRISGCVGVTVVETTVRGGGNTYGTYGALHIEASRVDLDRCDVTGRGGFHQNSPNCGPWSGYPGGPGLAVIGPTAAVRVLGGTYRGGNAGYGGPYTLCDGWPGSGISVEQGAVVLLRGVDVEAGVSWSSGAAPIEGPVVRSLEVARDLDVAPLARANGEVLVRASGTPGDQAWLLTGVVAGTTALGLHEGTLGFAPAHLGTRVSLGVFDGNGRVTATVALPMPAATEASVWQMQVAAHGPAGVRLSAARPVTVLGAHVPLAPAGRAVRVDAAAGPLGDGLAWMTAFSGPKEAFRYAIGDLSSGGELWLREGEYVVGSDGVNRLEPLRVRPGTILRGGFRGDEQRPEERDPTGRWAILTGDALGNDQPGFGHRGDNARQLVQVVDGAVPGELEIERLWFRGVEELSTYPLPGLQLAARTKVLGCRVTDCRTDTYLMTAGSLHMERTMMRGNHAAVGVFTVSPGTVVAGCEVVGNFFEGAALSHYGSNWTLMDSSIASNVMPSHGAAVWLSASNGAPSGTNHVMNCILWNNVRGALRDQSAQFRSSLGLTTVSYCCVGGWDGTHPGVAVQALDPRFVSPLGPDGVSGTLDDDYRLGVGSPCVDAGDTTAVPAWLTLDLDARARIADDPLTPDTGVGGPPVVDLGAYER